MTSSSDCLRRLSAASRRCLNSATIVEIASAAAVRSESAANAAYCEMDVALDVVCDCNAAIERDKIRGAIDQPIRQPVMANDFATPSTTTKRVIEFVTESNDGASDSYEIAR